MTASLVLDSFNKKSSIGAYLFKQQRHDELLERDIRKLQLERDLLMKANELLKKCLCVDLPLMNNQEETRLVNALKHTYVIDVNYPERSATTILTGGNGK